MKHEKSKKSSLSYRKTLIRKLKRVRHQTNDYKATENAALNVNRALAESEILRS
jgi:hypothetical protein